MTRATLVDVGTVARMLGERALELCAELLPAGVRAGAEWTVGSVGGERGTSMAVHVGPARPGVWSDFSTGEGGDALDLVTAVRFGGDKRLAIDWARSWLGLDRLDPARLAAVQAYVPPKAAARPDDGTEARRDAIAQDVAARRDRARRMFDGARHELRGTLAADYLMTRGIDLAALGRQPGRLGFMAACWCDEVKANLPAMVAAIQLRGHVVGVHRTWLEPLGPGAAGKARLTDPKKTLGPWGGGCIPLWRGDDPRKWKDLWGDAAASEITLTEGIENALSVAVAQPHRRVAACVSLAGLTAIALPPAMRVVTIAADNDAAGSRAAAGLGRAIDALTAQGREVRIARAPAPHKDFNDWLQALRVDARVAVAG